jgi:hypothetical protein
MKLFNCTIQMFKYSLFFSFSLVLLFLSCEKEEKDPSDEKVNELEIKIQPYFGEQLLVLDSSYSTNENYKIQFTDIKFYLTNIQNGGKSLSSLGFFDFANTSTNFIKVAGSSVDFTNLTALLGVDSVRNHSDPSAFDNLSPLNILNAGEMHWGWNPGYIFMKIDAKLDTINDGINNFNHFISYHVGKDENIGNLNFSIIPWKKVSDFLSYATLKVDLNSFLTSPQAINLKTETITHSASGQEALSTKAMQNFVNSFSFLP